MPSDRKNDGANEEEAKPRNGHGRPVRRKFTLTRMPIASTLVCCRRPVAPSPRRPVVLASSCPNRANATTAGGFILWEVLLAFGIFCLVSVGFIAALEQTIFTVILVRDESEIRHDFENFFAEARAEKLQPGTRTLTTSDDRIRYERQVQALTVKNQQGVLVPNLFEITLTARWMVQNQERTDEAKLTVYQP